MNSLKPKEPLMATMLSILLPGLGQLYTGRIWRGLLFSYLYLMEWAIFLETLCTPTTKLYPYHLFWAFGFIAFTLFSIMDSYHCAEEWNFQRDLKRKITAGGRMVWIGSILFSIFIFNPSGMVYYSLRTNVVQPFTIPSASMRHTLIEGDRFLVDKAVYKKSGPKRGDIVVFHHPTDAEKIFVQRVAGLPTETLEIRDNRLLINGSFLKEGERLAELPYFNEGEYGKKGQVVKIPQECFYVLGDNSSESRDSRFWGFVPRKNIIGRAYKIYYPFKRSGPIE